MTVDQLLDNLSSKEILEWKIYLANEAMKKNNKPR